MTSAMTPSKRQEAAMALKASHDDLKRDLQATVAARREIGPAYDEHFIEALSDRLTTQIQQQVQQQVRQVTPSASRRPSHNKRMLFAFGSLICGAPVVIIGASLGMVGFLSACLLIFAINLVFALLP
jgi:hypothetical protein